MILKVSFFVCPAAFGTIPVHLGFEILCFLFFFSSQDEKRRKQFGKHNERQKIVLEAVLDTTCKKCGGKGTLFISGSSLRRGNAVRMLCSHDDAVACHDG